MDCFLNFRAVVCLIIFSHVVVNKLSSDSDLPAGARSCTAPPGGYSPSSPGAGPGNKPSEGQSAPSRTGPGDQGEGSPPEGQMPGGTGIRNFYFLKKNTYSFLSACFFLVFHRCWLSKSSLTRRRGDSKRISIRCFNPECRQGYQQLYVSSYSHTQKHTNSLLKHLTPPNSSTRAHRITLICRKETQQ